MRAKLMNYYLDIQLLPDPEFASSILMNAVYGKLHRYLAEHKTAQIGVSFPKYSLKPRSLGQSLRLHGSQTDLQALVNSGWLGSMQSYSQVHSVQSIPSTTTFCQVRRVQAKSNIERLARRYAKRHSVSLEQALEQYAKADVSLLELPFINLNSQSTGQRFSLFIQQAKQAQPAQGQFNAYGLSSTANLPWF